MGRAATLTIIKHGLSICLANGRLFLGSSADALGKCAPGIRRGADAKDVGVIVGGHHLAAFLDNQNIVVGRSVLGEVGSCKGYTHVGDSEKNEKAGATDNDALGQEELLLHAKLFLKERVDLVVR